jgi:hypothetical protein
MCGASGTIAAVAKERCLCDISCCLAMDQIRLQGTDRGFRNIGKSQSDAGEIPKRINTTARKFVMDRYNNINRISRCVE